VSPLLPPGQPACGQAHRSTNARRGKTESKDAVTHDNWMRSSAYETYGQRPKPLNAKQQLSHHQLIKHSKEKYVQQHHTPTPPHPQSSPNPPPIHPPIYEAGEAIVKVGASSAIVWLYSTGSPSFTLNLTSSPPWEVLISTKVPSCSTKPMVWPLRRLSPCWIKGLGVEARLVEVCVQSLTKTGLHTGALHSQPARGSSRAATRPRVIKQPPHALLPSIRTTHLLGHLPLADALAGGVLSAAEDAHLSCWCCVVEGCASAAAASKTGAQQMRRESTVPHPNPRTLGEVTYTSASSTLSMALTLSAVMMVTGDGS